MKSRLEWAIEKLIELHHKRWQGRTEHYAFSSPNYISFHKSVMHEFIKQNRLRLFCLELDEKIISMLYCYKWKDTMYYFQGGFDPDYYHLQPGQVIMGHAIESAIKERLKVFDMLKGNYEYKASLAKNCKHTWYFNAFKREIPIYIYRLNFHWLPTVKTKIKELLGTKMCVQECVISFYSYLQLFHRCITDHHGELCVISHHYSRSVGGRVWFAEFSKRLLNFSCRLGKGGLQHSVLRLYSEIKTSSEKWNLNQYYSTVVLGMLGLSIIVTVVLILIVLVAPTIGGIMTSYRHCIFWLPCSLCYESPIVL